MILQALKEYYDRKAADPDSGIARFGWEWKEIPYLIVLDADGTVVDVASTYEGEGKKRVAKRFLVPQGEKKTNGVKANLLWENAEYAFGLLEVAADGTALTSPKSGEKNAAFLAKMDDFGPVEDDGWNAVAKFLAKPFDVKIAELSAFDGWKASLVDKKALFTFRLDGGARTVAESEAVRDAIERKNAESDGPTIRCLITGREAPLANLHTGIKGVWGGNPTGTNIVGFNLAPFCSFGKKQGENAPVGQPAMFAYTTALNALLDKNSENRLQVGEASTVVWGQKKNDLETAFVSIFAEPPKDDPDRGVNAVKALNESVHNGAWSENDSKDRFYILGLSPNAARLAIRFWQVSTVKEASENIVRYFDDVKIARGPKDKEFLSIFRILVSLAVEGKSENIPPTLEGDFVRAIMENLPFPRTLLQAAIRRTRAEQNVNYPRASIIKGCINRFNRFNRRQEEELQVSLDLTNKNIGYRLGRLFATLEKIQAEANPGLNATIRDRFYGAASGTPVTVFPNLMRLKNHHLAKLENGRRIYFERLLGEIADEIDDFPRSLSMENQGRFAIGYYHQARDFFTKKEDKADAAKE